MSNYQLGIVAAGKRNIKSGIEYDKYFPMVDFKNTIVDKDGGIEDIMFQLGKVIGQYHTDTKKIAPLLRGANLKDTCQNIFNFIYNHIQYKLDKAGEEQLRRPARSWHDRVSGVDCDCMSIFAASCLMNLGIYNFKLRITKYNNKPNYQHVYVIVPHSNGEYVIDPVLDTFNYQKPFTQKKDYSMENLGIPISVLHGIDGSDLQHKPITFPVIEGLLNGAELNTEQEIYNHLVQTYDSIVNNPGIIHAIDYPPAFVQMLEYAINNFWKGTEARDKAFEILAMNEATINQQMGINDDDLDEIDEEDDYLLGFEIEDNTILVDDDDIYSFDGLGRPKKSKAERKAKRTQRKADRKVEKKENKTARKQERKQAKGFFRKVGVTLKQGGKAAIKYNPLTIAARNGFLLGLKINIFRLSARLKWGYASEEQARQAGISQARHDASKKALARVENLFVRRMKGSRVALRNAILSGKHNLSGYDDEYFEAESLGSDPATVGLITAGLSFLTVAVTEIAPLFRQVDADEGYGDIWDDVEEFSEEDLEDIELDGMEGLGNVFRKTANAAKGNKNTQPSSQTTANAKAVPKRQQRRERRQAKQTTDRRGGTSNSTDRRGQRKQRRQDRKAARQARRGGTPAASASTENKQRWIQNSVEKVQNAAQFMQDYMPGGGGGDSSYLDYDENGEFVTSNNDPRREKQPIPKETSNIFDTIKANPIIAGSIALVGLSVIIPPIRRATWGRLFGSKKTSTKGLGKPAKTSKITSIKLR